MQAIRPWSRTSKIDKLSGEAREHFGIVDHGVEIIHSLQLPCQMKSNFNPARLDI